MAARSATSSATSATAASRREQRRLQHHDLSRTQLLDAAEEVFGTKGYHEATLKEVAELAEFSVGSVYSFFENKDDLFLQVFLRRGEDFVAGIRAALAEDGPPLEQLRRIVHFEVGFFRAHPHFGRLYLRTASLARPLPGNGDAGGVETFGEVMAVQTQVLLDGQAGGTIRAGDPAGLLGVLSGMVTAFISGDPVVQSGGQDTSERLGLTVLADMVAGAFATVAVR